MTETVNIRKERIERLLRELHYEVERGMMERDIDETMTFQFFVPISNSIPDGVVQCRFETRPVHWGCYDFGETPRLRIVGKD